MKTAGEITTVCLEIKLDFIIGLCVYYKVIYWAFWLSLTWSPFLHFDVAFHHLLVFPYLYQIAKKTASEYNMYSIIKTKSFRENNMIQLNIFNNEKSHKTDWAWAMNSVSAIKIAHHWIKCQVLVILKQHKKPSYTFCQSNDYARVSTASVSCSCFTNRL